MLSSRIGGEFSRLEFTGDTEPGGRARVLQAVAAAHAGLRQIQPMARARGSREVGQLDFADFTSSVSLADERVEGGNPDLRPQTDWSPRSPRTFVPPTDLAVTLARVPSLGERHGGFHACRPTRGSRGRARQHRRRAHLRSARDGARAGAGPRGATVTVDATWQRSSVTDPLTLRIARHLGIPGLRSCRGLSPGPAEIRLGTHLHEKSVTSSFLLARDRTQSQESFARWLHRAGAVARLAAEALRGSLLGQHEWRERLLFDPDRRAGIRSARRFATPSGHLVPAEHFGKFLSAPVGARFALPRRAAVSSPPPTTRGMPWVSRKSSKNSR